MSSLLSRLKERLFPSPVLPASAAYDRWAPDYDNQPGNIVLRLDEELMRVFLAAYPVAGKHIADIGCGTGRHWPALFQEGAASLTGYDVSSGMLERLKEKFPAARVFLSEDHLLSALPDEKTDLVISTLTMAHLENPLAYLQEWYRVLKPGGLLYITDFHPAVLARGGKRSFVAGGETLVVKNYIHPLARLREWAGQPGFSEIRCTERMIDETIREWYAAQQALHLYEAFKGLPLLYSLLLKKPV